MNLKGFHLTDLPDSLKFKKLKKFRHKWGKASDFVTEFKLYATQLNIPEILQLELFEDRVNPLDKSKLQDLEDLEPQRRTIETYSYMLMTYDNKRDRHWNLESTKRKRSFSEEYQGKKNSNHGIKKNPHLRMKKIKMVILVASVTVIITQNMKRTRNQITIIIITITRIMIITTMKITMNQKNQNRISNR